MSHQQRMAGANWTLALCGHPVRPHEPHGTFLGELVCAPCDQQYTEMLRAIALADLALELNEQRK